MCRWFSPSAELRVLVGECKGHKKLGLHHKTKSQDPEGLYKAQDILGTKSLSLKVTFSILTDAARPTQV